MPFFKNSILISVVTDPQDRAFAAQHAGGWSEQYWSNAAISANGIRQTCSQRATFLPIQCSVIGHRSQSYTIVNGRLIPGGASATQLIFPGNVAYTVDVPQAALNLRLQGAGVANVGKYTIRGMPDEVVKRGEYQPDQFFRTVIDQWLNGFKNATFGFVGRDLAATQTSVTGGDGTSVAVANSAGFAAGDTVRFVKVKNMLGQNIVGLFQIKAVPDATHITINGNVGGDAVAGGRLRKHNILFFNISGGNVGRVGVKKVGRPFAGYVGRRSKRKPVGV